MPQAVVVPFETPTSASAEDIQAAFSKFCKAGFGIMRVAAPSGHSPTQWRVKKLTKGQDRILNDDELVLLARSLRA